MKKGDLVRYEYLTKHPSGVGWQFHKGVGLILEYNSKEDSYVIITEKGNVIQRLDMQIEVLKTELKKENAEQGES